MLLGSLSKSLFVEHIALVTELRGEAEDTERNNLAPKKIEDRHTARERILAVFCFVFFDTSKLIPSPFQAPSCVTS